MPQIISSNALNPAALQVDDLYISIVNPPAFLTSAPSDVLGIVGTASWGPINTPTLMGSTVDLVRNFGPITTSVINGGPSGGIDTHDLPTDVSLSFAQSQAQASLQIWGVRVSDGTDTKSAVTLNTAAPASAGIVLTALYSGTLGNQLSAQVVPGSKSNTYTVSIVGFPGSFAETYPNIASPAASGSPTFWQNLMSAINNGLSGFRGPSQLVLASAAFATASQPATGNFTLSGGADGRSGVTSANLVGSNLTSPYTGFWALRNLNPDIGVAWIAGMIDATQYSTMQTMTDQEGCIGLFTFPTGTTSVSAIAVKNAVGIDDPNSVYIKDWLYFFDPVNNQLRLVAPMPVWGGTLGCLPPQYNPTNKPVYGIVGTERNNPITGTLQYSYAELGQLESAGISLITNPIPAGNVFGIRNGQNSSSNPVEAVVEYARMTNYLVHSFTSYMGKFVGQNQTTSPNDPLRSAVRLALGSYLENLVQLGQIDSYVVVCDLTNNSAGTIASHYLYATVLVRYVASVKFFVINMQGGTTVVTSTNALNTGLQSA